MFSRSFAFVEHYTIIIYCIILVVVESVDWIGRAGQIQPGTKYMQRFNGSSQSLEDYPSKRKTYKL